MSPRQPHVRASDLLRAFERSGWIHIRTRGSHVHLRHPDGHRQVTIPVHPGRTLRPATLRSILNQAGMSIDDLRDLL